MKLADLPADKQIENYQFSLKALLGTGSYSQVYLGKNINNGEQVAIKVVQKRIMQTEYVKHLIMNEIDIMKQLDHPNIVKLHTVIFTANNVYIVQEYCNGGDLENILKAKKKISQEESLAIMRDVVKGYKKIKQMGMIHRDLKLANIFASNGVYKIGDFGFGKTLLHEDETISSKLVGTPLYMSPQCLLQKQYTSKTDVWSLGIMLFEILYGDVPWDAPNPAILIQRITTRALQFPPGVRVTEDVKNFLRGALQLEESNRLSWEDVYEIFGVHDKPEQPYEVVNMQQPIVQSEPLLKKTKSDITAATVNTSTSATNSIFSKQQQETNGSNLPSTVDDNINSQQQQQQQQPLQQKVPSSNNVVNLQSASPPPVNEKVLRYQDTASKNENQNPAAYKVINKSDIENVSQTRAVIESIHELPPIPLNQQLFLEEDVVSSYHYAIRLVKFRTLLENYQSTLMLTNNVNFMKLCYIIAKHSVMKIVPCYQWKIIKEEAEAREKSNYDPFKRQSLIQLFSQIDKLYLEANNTYQNYQRKFSDMPKVGDEENRMSEIFNSSLVESREFYTKAALFLPQIIRSQNHSIRLKMRENRDQLFGFSDEQSISVLGYLIEYFELIREEEKRFAEIPKVLVDRQNLSTSPLKSSPQITVQTLSRQMFDVSSESQRGDMEKYKNYRKKIYVLSI